MRLKIGLMALGILAVLLPITVAASTLPVEAYLVTGDGQAQPHIQVAFNRPGVTEVNVMMFDEEGVLVGYSSVTPTYLGSARGEVSMDIAPHLADKVRSARIAGYTVRSSGEREPAFDTGLLDAVPMSGCFSFCAGARQDCSYSCSSGSGEAVFSCGPDGNGGCTYTCRCCDYPDCNGP